MRIKNVIIVGLMLFGLGALSGYFFKSPEKIIINKGEQTVYIPDKYVHIDSVKPKIEYKKVIITKEKIIYRDSIIRIPVKVEIDKYGIASISERQKIPGYDLWVTPDFTISIDSTINNVNLGMTYNFARDLITMAADIKEDSMKISIEYEYQESFFDTPAYDIGAPLFSIIAYELLKTIIVNNTKIKG